MLEFYMIIARKIFFPFFGGGRHVPPPPLPTLSPTLMRKTSHFRASSFSYDMFTSF